MEDSSKLTEVNPRAAKSSEMLLMFTFFQARMSHWSYFSWLDAILNFPPWPFGLRQQSRKGVRIYPLGEPKEVPLPQPELIDRGNAEK